MAVIPINRAVTLAGKPENFYVPAFEVRIHGKGLPRDVARDVTQVSFHDSQEEIDSFELTINNWDADRRQFKYEPARTGPAGVFDPGTPIELWLGYAGDLRQMLTGFITTIEPSYPESGGPTLSVRGFNVLYQLRKSQHTWSWFDKRDSEIAEEVVKRPVSEDRPGMGKKIEVPNKRNEDPEEFVFMDNEYDVVFLINRARRKNYSLHLKAPDKLFFGPSPDERNVTYLLEWGKTLVSFQPTLTSANQVEQVTVRGWDRRRARAIEGTAHLRDCRVNADQRAVAQAVQGRHEVVNAAVRSKRDAERMARDILSRLAGDIVTGSGATVGLPDLRTGRKVQIQNLGSRIDGEYFVTETNHTIGDGYRTTFTAHREGPGTPAR
jgi:phage protein D